MEHLKEDEQEIVERSGRATPGPWMLKKPPNDEDGWATDVIVAAAYGRQAIQAIYATPGGGQFPANDAEFIAHARADVPLLLSRLIEARKRVEELERENRWIPVSEGQPTHTGEYLIAGSFFGKVRGCEYSVKYESWKGMGSGKAITHWRPLPSPPSVYPDCKVLGMAQEGKHK